MRFRVDDVFSITGLGCVVVGEVEEGTLRPPCPMQLVPVAPRGDAPGSVMVAGAMAHHKEVAEVGSGTKAGLTLRGIAGDPLWPVPSAARFPLQVSVPVSRWPVRKGDRLISP
ncbi:MAG TPA: hypothetical protein VGP88_03670 [Thermoplasmata archaeon]|nr:hypothetical protein [Thermoplasmata archaeon]